MIPGMQWLGLQQKRENTDHRGLLKEVKTLPCPQPHKKL